MRFLVILFMTAALGFSAYWFHAASLIERESRAFVADTPQLRAEIGRVGGFPFHFHLPVAQPVWRDRADTPVWQADALSLSAQSHRPNLLQMTFPDVQQITHAGRQHQLNSRAMIATLGLDGQAEITSLTMQFDEARIDPPLVLAQTGTGRFELRQNVGATYRLTLDLDAPALAPALRDLIDSDATLPDTLASIRLAADLTFATPVEPTAPIPAIEAVAITEAQITWGALVIEADGAMARTPQDGLLDGTFMLRLADWRPFHAILLASGTLPSDAAIMAGLFLGALAEPGGTSVSLPLDIRRSVVSLGPFGLFQLPPI